MKRFFGRQFLGTGIRRVVATVVAISMVLIPVRFPGTASAVEQEDVVVPNYFADDYSTNHYTNGITYKWVSNAFEEKFEGGKYLIYSGAEKNTGAPVVGNEENRIYIKAEMYDAQQKKVIDIAQSWQDYTVEADVVRIDPKNDSQWVGITGRVTQTDKGICYYALAAMGDKIRLYKAYISDADKWERIKIQESNSVKGVVGENIHLKLVFDGNNIKGYANDVQVVNYTDEGFYGVPLTSGSAGMYMYGRAWNGSFDNFLLTHDSDITAFYDSFADDRYFAGSSYQWKTTETPVSQNVTYTWTETLKSGTTSQLTNNEYIVNVGNTYSYNNLAILNGTSTDGTDVDQTWENYTVEVDVKRENATGTGDQVFLMGRLQPDRSGYGLLLSGSGFSLWEFTDTGLDNESRFKDVGSGLSSDMYNQWVHMKLSFKDNTVTTTLTWTDSEGNPGMTEYTYTDDSFGAGGVGLCVQQADGTAPLNVHFDNFKVTLENGSVVYSDPFDSPIPSPAQDATYTLTEEFGQNGTDTATSTLADGKYTIHIPKDRTWNYVWLNGVTAGGLDVDQTWTDYSVEVDLRRNATSDFLNGGLVGRVTPVYQNEELVGYSFYRFKAMATETKVDKVYWDTETEKFVTTADWRLYNCDVANNEWRKLKVTFSKNTVSVAVYDEDGCIGTDSFTDSSNPLLSGGVGLMSGYTESNLSGSIDFDNLKVTMSDGRVVFGDAFNSAPTMDPVDVVYKLTEELNTATGKDKNSYTPVSKLVDGKYTVSTQNDRTSAYVWLNGTATVDGKEVDVDQAWTDYTVRVDISRVTETDNHTAGILGRITPVYQNDEIVGYQYYEIKVHGGDVRIYKQYWDKTSGTLKNTNNNPSGTDKHIARLYVGAAKKDTTTLEVVFAGKSIKINLYNASGDLINSSMADSGRTYTDDATYGEPLLSGGIALGMFSYSADTAWSVSFDKLSVKLANGTLAYSEEFDSVIPQDVTYQWTKDLDTVWEKTPNILINNEDNGLLEITTDNVRAGARLWLNGSYSDGVTTVDVDQIWENYTVEAKVCRYTDNTNFSIAIAGRVTPKYGEQNNLLGYEYYQIRILGASVRLYKVYWDAATSTIKESAKLREPSCSAGNGAWNSVKVVFEENTISCYFSDSQGNMPANPTYTYTDDGETYGAKLLTGGVGIVQIPADSGSQQAMVPMRSQFDDFTVTLADGTVVFVDDFSDDKYFADGGAVREDSYYPAGGNYKTGFDAEGVVVQDAYTPPAPAGDYANAFDPEGIAMAGGYAPAPSTEGCKNGFFEDGLIIEDAYTPALPEHWTIVDGVYTKNDANAYPMIVAVTGSGMDYAQNWKNYGVEADFMLTSDDAVAGVVFGYTDSGYYELRMDGEMISLYHVAATETLMGSADQLLDRNVWNFARVELEGKKINCYVNGILAVTATADADVCGTVGIKAVGGAKYDNFVVYPTAAGNLRRFGTFDFEVADIAQLLSNWNFSNTADWSVVDDTLRYTGANAVGSVNLKSKTYAQNYFVELIAVPATDTEVFAVTGRTSLDGKSYYQLTLDMQDGLTFTKTVNGATAAPLAELTKGDLYRDFGIMLIPGEEYKLRIEMFGTTLRCFVGEQRLFHLEDASVTAGVSGIAGSDGVAFNSLTTGLTYADPILTFVYADGTPVTDLTVFKGKVPDIKGMYLKVDVGDGNPQLILLDTVMDDSKFDEAATGTVRVPVEYEGVTVDFVYTMVERTAQVTAIGNEIAALDLANLKEADVDALSDRYNDLSAAEKAGISKENKDKLAAAQKAIDIQKYPELEGYDIIFKDEFDTAAAADAYTNAQIVTCTRNTGYWYVENGTMLQYFEDDYMRTASLESGFALKGKNFKAKSVSVDVQYIDPNQWIGFSVNFGPNGAGGYRFMISDKTTGYGGNRIRLYNNGALLKGVVEADENKWFKPGEWINLRMVFGDDGYIRCYVNDVLYLEAEDKLTVRHDAYHESGTVMLYSAEGWCRFDNLVVYGEELPYTETPVYNTDLKAGEYTDNFEDETAGKSPSHWIELNTEDKWLVKEDGGNKVYASKEHTADASETWLHVFETDVDYTAKLKVTQAGYYPAIALTARGNAKASYIRAGYDFTLQKWFVKYRLAENFDEVAIYAENKDTAVDFSNWVNVRMVLNGSELQLYKDGTKVLTADVGTKVGPGRVGVYTDRCNIEIDDVNLILTSGQGKVQDGVLEYYTSPMGITSTMGSYIEMPDGNILYYSDGYHAVSTDGGQTFTPTNAYSDFKTSTNIRLHNGDYVAIFTGKVNEDGVTPTPITAYRSTDGGHTWTSAALPTEAHSYAQPGGHVNEIKLADGTYRLFFTAPINEGEDAGSYARTFYSDDCGATWKESKTRAEDWCNLGVFCETFISAVSKDVTMSSGKVIPAGTLVHSTSYNSSGTIRYSLSYDGGVTWEGDYALPEILCPQGSCVFREDPSNPGTWYMLTLYTPQYQMYTDSNRDRNALFRSEDGLNWKFVCDVDRWGDNGDGGCDNLLHSTNAYMTVTEDYVFVNFGRNEEWLPGSNAVYGRIYRFEKDKLVDHAIPEEYIIQDKAITYIEGTLQDVPLNSATYADDVTFDVYYHDGTSEKVALREAFVSKIDTAVLGKQKVIADYKHFRTVFEINVVMGDSPVLSVADGKTYCGDQTVTVTDANNDLVSVTLNGNAVTLTDGKFTVSAAEGQQTVAATDKAGNVTTVKFTVNAAHTGGTATCKDKAICSVCGEAYGELAAHKGGEATCIAKAKCSVCGEEYGEKDADNHTKDAKWVNTADKHKKTYECCGATAVAEGAHTGGTSTCKDKAICSVCGEAYGELAAHKGGKATCIEQAQCSVCGKAYGELDADNHDGEAKWSKTAEKHTKSYDCCGKVVVAEEAHKLTDGKCECGYEAPAPVEPGEIENVTDSEENACGGTLDVKDEHLDDKLLTEEEKAEVQAGADIEISLKIEDISDKVSAADKTAVENKLNGMKVGMYLDINLEKQVGDKAPVKITKTNGAVTVTITVPADLINTDTKYVRTYKVIRVHEGIADILDAAFDAETGKLSFETDKFSTYTLVYSDAPSSDNSPTGDSAMIVLFGGLLALCVLAAGALLIPDVRKKLMGK